MRTFLLLLTAALLTTSGFGQYTRQSYPTGDKSPDAKPRDTGAWNVVSLHLTQVLVREAQVSYERFLLRRLSLEGAVGARIPNLSDHEVYNGMGAQDFDVNYKAYPFMRSYYWALGIKWSFVTPSKNPDRAIYLAAVPFYRYNFFPRTAYRVPSSNSMSAYAADESKYQRIPGLKLLLGCRLSKWQVDPTHGFYLDVFAGASIRRILTTTTTYGTIYGTDDPARIKPFPEPETMRTIVPFEMVQVGAKLSFAWARPAEE